MAEKLKLGKGLSIPREAMLQRYAILGMSGAGKSNSAVVMAERMYAAEVPWVVVDPKGDWWGLRSSKSGKSGGLDVPVFGGDHGDIPLYATGGREMADAVAHELSHSILDVSGFEKTEMLGFLIDFAERLYEINKNPLVLILEEADEYIPQNKESPLEAKSVGKWSRIVKRGRTRGLLTVLVALRNSELAKSVLNFSDTVIAHRATAKLDRDAVKGWVEYSGAAKEILDTLPMLEDGEAWVSSPQKLKMTERVQFDRRATFDSGATPDLDTDRAQVKLASIDLGSIEDRMKETIERAEAEDPEKLRRRIAELEKELETRPEAEPEEVEVKVPFIDPIAAEELRTAVEDAEHLTGRLPEIAERIEAGVAHVREEVARAEEVSGVKSATPSAPPAPPAPPSAAAGSPPPPAPVAPAATPQAPVEPDGDVKLGKAEVEILTVLAQFSPDGRSKNQIAILTSRSQKSSGFKNALGKLRTLGFAVGTEPVQATETGLAAIPMPPPRPTGADLLQHWLGKVGKAEREILEAVAAAGRPLTKTEIADFTDRSEKSSGFKNALGRLRTLGLIVGTDLVKLSGEMR